MSTASAVSISRHRSQQPAGAPARRKGFRADVQALRALAVVLVVLYHAHVPGARAGYVGVDVFFVISGFLITTQLVGEATRTGRVAFARFYARRVRRLLPAALTVVVATLAVSWLHQPPPTVQQVAVHALFTTFYGINYRLAAEGVDYQDASAPPSPLQHYWSLGVEEQFYLLWPVLVVAALWAARRWGRATLPLVLIAVVTVSLALSVTMTASNPTSSYFALHTRAWELGAGALVALGARRLTTVPPRAAAPVAWAGFAAIAASAVLYSDATAFPGSAALLPVGGAVLVIAAGCGGPARSITRAFGGRAVQGVGTLSYGWYLWHWPVLLLYPLVLQRGGARWEVNLAACLGALLLAHLTHRFVERPTQASRWGTPAWLAAGAAMSGATAGLAALVWAALPAGVGPGAPVTLARPADAARVQADLEAAVRTEVVPSNLTPGVWRAPGDAPVTRTGPERCMADYAVVTQGPCVYGDPAGRRTVALFGDSHMEQWQPALDAAGRDGGWKVVSWTKSSCPLPDRPVRQQNLPSHEYVECARWREATLRRITALRPDLVLVSQSDEISQEASTPAQYAAGSVATVDRLRGAGLRVTYVLDNPQPDRDVPTCLATRLDDATACAGRADGSRAPERRADLRRALRAAGVTTVDPARWTCWSGTCPAVVGNVLVYRDGSHVTATYSRWLAPVVMEVLTSSG